jgi:hypothetical protein
LSPSSLLLPISILLRAPLSIRASRLQHATSADNNHYPRISLPLLSFPLM